MKKRKRSNHNNTEKKPFSGNAAKRRRDIQAHDTISLYGFHAVQAALMNPKRVCHKLQLTKNAHHELHATLEKMPHKLTPEIVTPDQLKKQLPDGTVHQGVMLETQPLDEPELESLVATGRPLVILDQVTDPRNIGAILRSATVFGAAGLITTRHHSPIAAGALAKAASGALEVTPICAVGNLARCLKTLAQAGYLTIGLDETGNRTIAELPQNMPIALVMGAEGKGLRRLTKENCDELVRLPHADQTGSQFTTLNVSNAAAVSLYAVFMNAGD
ncbi:MAG: 23S rRNA (guanosine(2251)-2'-O)-methyltransferase RlmB [Parvibaculales bacterium]